MTVSSRFFFFFRWSIVKSSSFAYSISIARGNSNRVIFRIKSDGLSIDSIERKFGLCTVYTTVQHNINILPG